MVVRSLREILKKKEVFIIKRPIVLYLVLLLCKWLVGVNPTYVVSVWIVEGIHNCRFLIPPVK